jgi:hypothetical protein
VGAKSHDVARRHGKRNGTRHSVRVRCRPIRDRPALYHAWALAIVHFVETTERLIRLFDEAGLAPELLQPWPAWKVFKHFLREPVEGAASDTLVQMGAYIDADGPRIHLYFVRQFSDELAHELPERDEQLAHLVCDIVFPAASPRAMRYHELWSQDFRSHSAFIDAVERDSAFQKLMNAEPVSSRVFWEEA